MIELDVKSKSPADVVLSLDRVERGPCSAVIHEMQRRGKTDLCGNVALCKRHAAVKCCALVIGIRADVWKGRSTCEGDCYTCENPCDAIKELIENG